MKLITLLTHPYIVLASFCLVLISGESFGGVYLLYIAMAVPHGGIHAILALIGAGLLILSHERYGHKTGYWIYPLANIIGVVLLYLSLITFFYNSKGYNNGTFEQTVPLISLIVFGAVSVGYLIRTIWSQFSRPILL